jgi:translation initiation factor 2 gamma subunit (eIF-2gamma)
MNTTSEIWLTELITTPENCKTPSKKIDIERIEIMGVTNIIAVQCGIEIIETTPD